MPEINEQKNTWYSYKIGHSRWKRIRTFEPPERLADLIAYYEDTATPDLLQRTARVVHVRETKGEIRSFLITPGESGKTTVEEFER